MGPARSGGLQARQPDLQRRCRAARGPNCRLEDQQLRAAGLFALLHARQQLAAAQEAAAQLLASLQVEVQAAAARKLAHAMQQWPAVVCTLCQPAVSLGRLARLLGASEPEHQLAAVAALSRYASAAGGLAPRLVRLTGLARGLLQLLLCPSKRVQTAGARLACLLARQHAQQVRQASECCILPALLAASRATAGCTPCQRFQLLSCTRCDHFGRPC